nr:helix-turn-helix domain-containing protein [Salipiger sp. PrR003]
MAAVSENVPPSRQKSLVEIAARFVGHSLADIERAVIISTVSRCRTDREASEKLGIHLKTLRSKLKKIQDERIP